MSDRQIPVEDRNRLRTLAKKQLECSQLPIMQERTQRWYQHNDLAGQVPMVYFETWTCEQDLLPELQCTSDTARGIELQFLRTMLNHEMIDDDRVVPPWFSMGWHTRFSLFDLPVARKHSQDSQGRSLGHEFEHPIRNLPEDLKRLKPSVYGVNREGTLQQKTFLEELFGDILPVRMGMGSPGLSLSQHMVHFMGMETMMFAMIDHPEAFHQMMQQMVDDYLAYYRWMEKENLLFLNHGNDGVAQGTWGFTKDLPKEQRNPEDPVHLGDLWGYMDSQETVSISPAMFEEFFFPYYLQGAKVFGLLSYGCCEPVHAFWEGSLSRLPNLRKISISPWCDEKYMGEVLQGTDVIYHRKPSPNFVGVGETFDEEGFREHIAHTVTCAKGCHLEISFRDVYSLGGDSGKPRRAVEIVREVIDRVWT